MGSSVYAMILSFLLSTARAEEPTPAPADPFPAEPVGPEPVTSLDEPATPAEGCAAPSTVGQLRGALDTSVEAWAAFDIEGLQAAAETAEGILTCLGEVIGPEDVGAYWRVQGLVAFSRRDIALTEVALGVARRVQPTYALPGDVVPEQHPLYQMWTAAGLATAPGVRELAPPIEGWTQVDGRRATSAPSTAPFVFQWVKDSGVASTQKVPIGATPIYELPPPPRRQISKKVFIASLASGLVAGGALGTAAVLKSDYLNSPEEEGLMQGTRTANTAFGATGFGLAAVSAGLSVGALVIGDW